jgi:hypothetical protein
LCSPVAWRPAPRWPAPSSPSFLWAEPNWAAVSSPLSLASAWAGPGVAAAACPPSLLRWRADPAVNRDLLPHVVTEPESSVIFTESNPNYSGFPTKLRCPSSI